MESEKLKGSSHDWIESGSQTLEQGIHGLLSLLKMSTCKYTHAHVKKPRHACVRHTFSTKGTSCHLPCSAPNRQSLQRDLTFQSSCKQMSLTLTPLPGLICPDSHRKWAHSLWMVCALLLSPLEGSVKQFAVTLSLSKAKGLRHVSLEKVRPAVGMAKRQRGSGSGTTGLHPQPPSNRHLCAFHSSTH